MLFILVDYKSLNNLYEKYNSCGKMEVRKLEAEAYLSELKREWPEIFRIYEKLNKGETLNTLDMEWIEEISKESGWSVDDVVDEIKNADKEPSSRIEIYQRMFEEYYNEAKELEKKGDRRQAGEKIWGAITALIKLFAAKKGVGVIYWSAGEMDRFISSNVEEKYKKLFRELLYKGQILHFNFYEDNLSEEGFKETFDEVVQLIEEAKKIVVG